MMKVPQPQTVSNVPQSENRLPGTSLLRRREFLKSAGFAGATALILPRIKLFGADAPSNKLNLALIATGHRAQDHFAGAARENVVAICDINEQHLASAAKKFPQAKQYADWRQCLEQKDIDAIICCTLDHTHAFVTNWAMNRGKHVYCEKPLVNSVEEARVIRATWQKNKNKLATQVGTQRHQFANFNRVREMIRDGAIGKLEEVSAWGNRKVPRAGYLPAEETPKYINYDLWLGPSPFHPYNSEYFKGGCLHWNMYWDWGTGQVGDMGSHTMDLAWNAIDAGLPTSAEGKGDPFNPDVTPVKLETHFDIPANDWRSDIRVSWYQGGALPESPHAGIDFDKIGHGVMFEGSSGCLVADFQSRFLMPRGTVSDLTYYHPRSKADLLPAMKGNFQQEWFTACKGNLKTSCDFGYATDMIEMMLLGLVAYRVGKKINYDGATGKVTDCGEANDLLRHTYRKGWALDG